MKKQTIPAFMTEALYAKSQVFINRGLAAKNRGELEEYQLWASIALELLGKACLSNTHPALVADPSHYQSLFAACGRPLSVDVKTITAKTLFLRLGHISKEFDSRVRTYCEQLSLRRNSEIHSGESPFSGISQVAWEQQFWYVISILLSELQYDLEEWLGAEGAKVPKSILSNADEAVKFAVKERISQVKRRFGDKHPDKPHREHLISESKSIQPWSYYHEFSESMDGFATASCPSCGGTGVVGGIEWDEVVHDTYDEDDPLVEIVDVMYLVEQFFCTVCALRLSGVREIRAASIPEEFTKEKERERVFEPDYGNE